MSNTIFTEQKQISYIFTINTEMEEEFIKNNALSIQNWLFNPSYLQPSLVVSPIGFRDRQAP